MKHLKKFENFQPVNELTGALVDRARRNAVLGAEDDNTIHAAIKDRQSKDFSTYTNPALISFAEKLGLSLKRFDEECYEVDVKTKDNENTRFYITNNGTTESLNVSQFDSNTLRKLQKLIDAIQKDNTSENEL